MTRSVIYLSGVGSAATARRSARRGFVRNLQRSELAIDVLTCRQFELHRQPVLRNLLADDVLSADQGSIG